mgnify:FL=1
MNPGDKFLEHRGDRPPLGLAYLSSYVKSLRQNSRIWDLNHHKEAEFMKYALDDQPQFVCYSVATPNYNDVLRQARDLKAAGYRGKIIAGGQHVTALPFERPTLDTFDHVVVGEGENALMQLIHGEESKVILSTPIENIDTLPMPDREGLQLDRYTMKLRGKKATTAVSSRGCVYRCRFCGSAKRTYESKQTNKEKAIGKNEWRSHSPKRVAGELDEIVRRFDKSAVYYGDDIFTFNRARTMKIAEEIGTRDYRDDLTLRVTTRVDLVDLKMLKALAKIGVDVISFGFESGNEEILKRIDKGGKATNLKAHRDARRACREAGIAVKGFFIVGHPGETMDTARDTIRFAKELDLEYADVYPWTPYPASPFWDNPSQGQEGMDYVRPEGDWDKYYQVGAGGKMNILIKHPNLTSEQILQLIDEFHQEVGKKGLTYD